LSANHSVEGAGGSLNLNFEVVRNLRLFASSFWSSGGGRDIFGLGPDFIVRPLDASGAYTLSPIHAGASVLGAEWQATPNTTFYAYYGGAYFGRNYSLQPLAGATCAGNVNFTCVGYGYPGSSNNDNRSIQEGTFGWNQTFWKNPSYGALALLTQASYVQRKPWFVAAGTPRSAQLGMAYVNLRYTLP
jgi:hypothetical protein